jgi:hypothetical protein
VKRLIGAFLIGATIGFLVGLVAPPRERRFPRRSRDEWGIETFERAEFAREVAAQASEK